MSDQNELIAVITSSEEPSKSQAQGIKEFLTKKYGKIRLAYKHDDNITDGFIMKVGSDVYDWTAGGRLRQLEDLMASAALKEKDIIPILHKKVDNWHAHIIPEEIGTVVSCGDSIAMVNGLENTTYGEILLFENGIRGIALDLKETEIGCILFDDGDDVSVGSVVHRTKKTAGVPVGDNFIGRVVNSLGIPIDGGDEIKADDYSPMEVHAPQIIDRQPVDTPLETGILAIDSMFPIGRGQRELIIGDRQTGKTTIAIDTILNQKDKDVICIYVAIGQKAGSVAATVKLLKDMGAMDYTCVVVAAASDPASSQYVAPYAGCAIAEYFMKKGKDALIIYDDLSKHAIAYRTLSLLLGRSSGREAYPGDIFYLHSRLLERSARLSEEVGGGSLTALPIVETQGGDISAYIPTNIISITDGQIFLESDLFFAGQRPAVNVGLSVSRVGGAAQSKEIKKVSGTLRLKLAQYKEKEAFTRFAGELDEETKAQLKSGKALMDMLIQKQHQLLTRQEMVEKISQCQA